MNQIELVLRDDQWEKIKDLLPRYRAATRDDKRATNFLGTIYESPWSTALTRVAGSVSAKATMRVTPRLNPQKVKTAANIFAKILNHKMGK